jgi:membrane protein implicated in regulation of membrane protease activity
MTFIGGGKDMGKFWLVNIVSLFLLLLLCMTGFLNWLALPRGYGATQGFLLSLRHFLLGVHQWSATLFVITIAIHITFHWGYIRANLKKKGLKG